MASHVAACPEALVKCHHCSFTAERQHLSQTHFHCDAARFGCEFVCASEDQVYVHLVDCVVSKCRGQFLEYERQITDLKQAVVPLGGMIAWSGNASEMPDGWALCDGRQGRPDFTSEFELVANPRKRRRGEGGQPVRYSRAYIIRRHAQEDVVAMGEVDDSDDQENEVEEEEEEE